MGTKNDSAKWLNLPGKEGVLYREHPTRKHGKRPDRYLGIRYRTGAGKRTLETLGWASEGWTAEKAVSLLRELKENVRIGSGPQSLREKRAMLEAARIAEAKLAARAKLNAITFGELAEYYYVWAKGSRVSASHIRQILDMHLLPVLGQRMASDITPDDINMLRARLETTAPASRRSKGNTSARLSNGTILHILKTIREVYNYALETPAPHEPGIMLYSGSNPARMSKRGRGVRPPLHDYRRLRVLNDKEIAALLGYQGVRAEFSEVHDMLLFSLDTGLRAGEMIHLRRESIDTENGTVRVIKGSHAERSTKRGKARMVHAGQLHPECLPMLRRRLATPSASPYLFPGKTAPMRDTNGLNRAMRRIMEKLGYNDGVDDPRNIIVWHTLRHTYATRMLESGCDVYMLKELMGHASVTTTEGYLHLCDRAKREQALARLALNRGQSNATRNTGEGVTTEG